MRATGKLSTAVHASPQEREQTSLAFPLPQGQTPAQPKRAGSDSSLHGSLSHRELNPPSRHAFTEIDPAESTDIASINQKLRELTAEAFSGQDYGKVCEALGIPRRHVSFYTAPTSDKNLPLALVIPWLRAFGSCEPLEWALAQVGLAVVGPNEQRLARIGEAYERLREARLDLDRAMEVEAA